MGKGRCMEMVSGDSFGLEKIRGWLGCGVKRILFIYLFIGWEDLIIYIGWREGGSRDNDIYVFSGFWLWILDV